MICAMREIRPDIVNSHCLTARIAAKICSVPVKIHTRHCAFDTPHYRKLFPVKQLCGALNMFLSDRIIAVAERAENLTEMESGRRK